MKEIFAKVFILYFFSFFLGCSEDRYTLIECNIFDENCNLELCEKFQDALIMVQLSHDGYPISIDKINSSIQFLEKTTGIKSHVNSQEVPVFSNDAEMEKDVTSWVSWFNENSCKQAK